MEGCNINWGNVITDISGKSRIAILKAILSGETEPAVLRLLEEGGTRNKIQESPIVRMVIAVRFLFKTMDFAKPLWYNLFMERNLPEILAPAGNAESFAEMYFDALMKNVRESA